MSFIDYMS